MSTKKSAIANPLRGRVAWIFPDDFDVDLIIGVENIKYNDPAYLKKLCMTSFEPDFAEKVRPGDIVVGGSNFGYGHPHYPAMIALRAVGIAAVVADSFSPGFWRGETYNGMPLVTVPGVSKTARRFDEVEVDWRTARIRFPGRNIELNGEPPSERTIAVLEAGGKYPLLLEQHRRRTATSGAPARG